MNTNSHNSNPSRPKSTTDPFSVSMNVTQWRQDVNAFTTATRQMLESIHQELSNGLAKGRTQVNVVPIQQTPCDTPELTSTLPAQDEHTQTANPPITSDDVANEGDQLLAKLKEQLAQQLNQ